MRTGIEVRRDFHRQICAVWPGIVMMRARQGVFFRLRLSWMAARVRMRLGQVVSVCRSSAIGFCASTKVGQRRYAPARHQGRRQSCRMSNVNDWLTSSRLAPSRIWTAWFGGVLPIWLNGSGMSSESLSAARRWDGSCVPWGFASIQPARSIMRRTRTP